MRTRVVLLTASAAAAVAVVAAAQPSVLPSRPLGTAAGTFDVGFRTTDLSGDEARFQRYRDVRDGAFLERFRFARETDRWFVALGADHVGYRDQRYFGEFAAPGKLKASFTWDQVPLFYSVDTRTLFAEAAPGVLRIDDAIQRGIETRSLSLASVAPQATAFDLRSRRHVAAFDLTARPRPNVDVVFKVTHTDREGKQPWGASFGFNHAVEVAAPVDWRTTDLNTAVEWGNGQGLLRLAYDGSWFRNGVQTLVWDNPIKFTDSTYATAYVAGDGTSQGRMALWPSSTVHTVSASGAWKLPRRSRATAMVSVGAWRQNEPLLPHTINTAIAPIPLARSTAEAEARTVAMHYTFTSRPANSLWLSARYRFDRFDNRTAPFETDEYVRFDQVVEEGPWATEPYGYTRHNVDVDLSFNPVAFASLKLGYGRGLSDRTFRIFERTTEDAFRASLDVTGTQWVTVRALYEISTRTGSGFDPHLLEEVGEQPAMRHYDIADRDRSRVTGILTITPVSAIGISASVAAGRDDYGASGFGLRDNRHRVYTVGVDLMPHDALSLGATYGFEKYTALQWSRAATPGPQFTDPTRDWSIDSDDRVHTLSASLEALRLIPRTELRFGYDESRAKAVYLYGVPANSTLFPGGFPASRQLPPVRNRLQTATADLLYFLAKNVGVGITYWHDRYRVDDFALGRGTIDRIDLPGGLLLGYVYRPYTANSVWVRLTYFW
jgi:MtrB/PioB family decaheme-associated outer membrane protein